MLRASWRGGASHRDASFFAELRDGRRSACASCRQVDSGDVCIRGAEAMREIGRAAVRLFVESSSVSQSLCVSGDAGSRSRAAHRAALASRPRRTPIADGIASSALRAPLGGGFTAERMGRGLAVSSFFALRSHRQGLRARRALAPWRQSVNLDGCAASCGCRSRAIPP